METSNSFVFTVYAQVKKICRSYGQKTKNESEGKENATRLKKSAKNKIAENKTDGTPQMKKEQMKKEKIKEDEITMETWKKKETILEVCTDSVESAIAAKKGGADRIELCSNLIIGGTTPDTRLYRMIQKETAIPARILIRPRFGDFCYSKYEKEMILEQIRAFREEGAQGVVIGALLPDGGLDVEFMKQCVDAAGECKVTCHRAFDMCRDASAALEELIALGVDTVLTSGQEPSAKAGADCLERLDAQARGRIHILAGAGVSDEVIPALYEKGIRQFHLSAKKELESRMEYRNERVNMGLAGMSEYIIWQTDEEKVRKARHVLEWASREL